MIPHTNFEIFDDSAHKFWRMIAQFQHWFNCDFIGLEQTILIWAWWKRWHPLGGGGGGNSNPLKMLEIHVLWRVFEVYLGGLSKSNIFTSFLLMTLKKKYMDIYLPIHQKYCYLGKQKISLYFSTSTYKHLWPSHLVNCAKCSQNPSKDAADWSVWKVFFKVY